MMAQVGNSVSTSLSKVHSFVVSLVFSRSTCVISRLLRRCVCTARYNIAVAWAKFANNPSRLSATSRSRMCISRSVTYYVLLAILKSHTQSARKGFVSLILLMSLLGNGHFVLAFYLQSSHLAECPVQLQRCESCLRSNLLISHAR